METTREELEVLYSAIADSKKQREQTGWNFTPKKRLMYELGFEDAVEWMKSKQTK